MSCKGKVEDEEEKEAKQEARDVVVRSCRPRRKRGIIIIIVVVVVVVVMCVDVPSASSGDAIGRRQRQCFSKVPVWVWPTTVLENDPPKNKKKDEKNVKKFAKYTSVYGRSSLTTYLSLPL